MKNWLSEGSATPQVEITPEETELWLEQGLIYCCGSEEQGDCGDNFYHLMDSDLPDEAFSALFEVIEGRDPKTYEEALNTP